MKILGFNFTLRLWMATYTIFFLMISVAAGITLSSQGKVGTDLQIYAYRMLIVFVLGAFVQPIAFFLVKFLLKKIEAAKRK